MSRDRNNVRRVKQRTVRQQQSVGGMNITALVIGSAIGSVVGEYAKRKVFDD